MSSCMFYGNRTWFTGKLGELVVERKEMLRTPAQNRQYRRGRGHLALATSSHTLRAIQIRSFG
jgi:calcineurin-like phosphoesterase